MFHHLLHKIKLLLVFVSIFILVQSCVSTEKIRTGQQALDRKQYAVAQQLFPKEISSSKGTEKASKCFLLGEAYRKTNQPDAALEWYLQAYELGWETSDLWWYTAMMLKQTNRYEEAIKFLDKIRPTSARGPDARRESDICRQAQIWIARKNPGFQAQILEGSFNGSVYLNTLYEDKRLVITSDHQQNNNPSYKWTGRYYSDIYLIDPSFEDGFERLPGWKSERYQRGNATFNNDFTEMIYTVCNEENIDVNFCKLYQSQKINERWTEGRPLDFIRQGFNYSHPFLSRDSILFFSSNPKNENGAYDLYFSVRNNNKWQTPVKLPAPINTPGNEKFPTVLNDTLYFSSDYLPGLGGLDIFKTYIRPNGEWSPPQNMMPPVNSGSDDFGLITLPGQDDETRAYFSSSRNNKQGLDQIFTLKRIKQQDLEKKEDSIVSEIAKKTFKRFLSLRVVEKIYADPENPNSRVIGKKAIAEASGIFKSTGKTFNTRQDGRYISTIAFDSSYTISIQKPGFLQRSISIPAISYPTDDNAEEIQTTSVEIVLQKPFIDREIVLSNIYYDLDQWFIREDAKPTLDLLILDLIDNPEYNVLIAAHTDCRADEPYNFELSRKRAESVVKYLVENGIANDRLSAKGYGKSKLIENCPCEECTEKQHQKNRRTTFTLLKEP